MFKCERCGTRYTNSEAKGLQSCPLCQEDGEHAPLALKLFVTDGPLTGAVERTRRVVRELGGRPEREELQGRTQISLPSSLPASAGRSKGVNGLDR